MFDACLLASRRLIWNASVVEAWRSIRSLSVVLQDPCGLNSQEPIKVKSGLFKHAIEPDPDQLLTKRTRHTFVCTRRKLAITLRTVFRCP